MEDYTYDLPDPRIARHPLPQRDASRLLVFRHGSITDSVYSHITDFLEPGSLLVFNNTRVIPARLLFSKSTGSTVEIFCLEPAGELAGSMAQRGQSTWKCLVGGIKKWKEDPLIRMAEGLELKATLVERGREACLVQFTWDPPELSFAEVLGLTGEVPLPPYLQRPAEITDKERYQTIYARFDGSVAAPTAGLHFTDQLLTDLTEHGHQTAFVTLHVGAGTFKPVKSDTIGDHEMHAEYFDVPVELVRTLRDLHGNKPIVPVGTTSLRTLESLYLMGRKLLNDPGQTLDALEIKQWDAFDATLTEASVPEALEALSAWMDRQGMTRLIARTQLLIAPGYQVRMADALVTNFHQPASTLLLLVAAFVGPDWRRIYQYALDNDFRFLSYGDGSLLFKTEG
jgi:S-adenosylmethionine:tRNA ribosyltransferase-isomerase